MVPAFAGDGQGHAIFFPAAERNIEALVKAHGLFGFRVDRPDLGDEPELG